MARNDPGARFFFVHARNCAVEFDLVVVAAGRKRRDLAQIIGEPGGFVRQEDEAVLDHRRLRVQAHDLVALGRIARDMREPIMDQVLNKLRARGSVLDQDDLRAEQVVQLSDGALELGKAELLAKHVEEIEVRAL